MEAPELLTDDMDIRDTKLRMRIGGNGDYYIELKENKRGEVIRLDTRIAMSGGNATTEVRLAVANLFKALRGETQNKPRVLPISGVSVSLPLDADQTWPTRDVLNKLIEASEILLHKKDYDGHGWEEIAHCVDLAKGIVKRIGNEL